MIQLTKEEIEQGNKLIAEFMKSCSFGEGVSMGLVNIAKYHSSWDWLMPVYKKFSEIKFSDSSVQAIHLKFCARINISLASIDIVKAYQRLTNGIEWYNKNNPNG